MRRLFNIDKTTLILLLVSVYILLLAKGGGLVYYIHPRYVVWATAAAVVTGVFATLSWWYKSKKGSESHEHSHNNATQSKWQSNITLAVLALAIILPAVPLSSRTVSQRFTLDKPSQHNLSLLLNTKDVSSLEGSVVTVEGFVYPATDSDQFYVTRFVVACCTADATPVGVLVVYPWHSVLKPNDWVRVTGTMHDVTIVPASVERIDQPAQPYLY